jgi:hypothetical protein
MVVAVVMPPGVSLLGPLLHLQPQQVLFRTTGGCGVVALVFIEGIAAFVQAINYILAFLFLVVMLLQTVLATVRPALCSTRDRWTCLESRTRHQLVMIRREA